MIARIRNMNGGPGSAGLNPLKDKRRIAIVEA
jgi:hypothetical protein